MQPAQQLEGITLENGWTVTKKATRKPNATGGHFSVGYIVRNSDGKKGFLKALDYTAAFNAPNTAEILQSMTRAYVFEKELCEKCAHLSKVARAIDSGSVNRTNDPSKKVEYLIFELADGDIRSHLDTVDKLDVVFFMKTLHHVACGLAQLHQARIAHQDLKPSNVLIYGTGETSKICDLGRAWDMNLSGPHDDLPIAGDQTYAPIEALYGVVLTDHRERRFGCDLYHLGSLIVFLFTRIHTNALILRHLPSEFRSINWSGEYENVLPFIHAAFELGLQDVAAEIPEFIRDDLTLALSQLCNPDPKRRGDPKGSSITRFRLDRYISLFDRLGRHAKLALYKNKIKNHART